MSNSISQLKTKGPIVICGPSGCGKSTLLKKLFNQYPSEYGFSVSHTTRSPRPGEENGVHYHFVTDEEFTSLISSNSFLEYNPSFSGRRYGTSIQAVKAIQDQGNKRCILDIDATGVRSIHSLHPNISKETLFIFLSPPEPALTKLHERLSGRGTESQETLKNRLKSARDEIEFAGKVDEAFDVVLVNDDIDEAYEKLRSIIHDGQFSIETKGKKGDELPKVWTDEEMEALFTK